MMPPIHVTKGTPLAIVDISLASSLANGWEETATAMQAGYDAFEVPDHLDYPIANSTLPKKYRGVTRLAYMLLMAKETLKKQYNTPIPTLLALPEPTRDGLHGDKLVDLFIEKIKSINGFQFCFADGGIEIGMQGQCSLAFQLNKAREILDTTHHTQVMIMSVDSFLAPQTLTALEAAPSSQRNDENYKIRVLRSGINNTNSDGFIPSEAAGILVVEKGENNSSPHQIEGIGFGNEPATIMSHLPNNGDGLAAAINQACGNANTLFTQHAWRIASISGEQFYFREAGMAQTRCIHKKIDNQPLWTPASHIGETGCVVGISMIAMAMNSFIKQYAPGSHVLCHMSNDNPLRAAFSYTYSAKRSK